MAGKPNHVAFCDGNTKGCPGCDWEQSGRKAPLGAVSIPDPLNEVTQRMEDAKDFWTTSRGDRAKKYPKLQNRLKAQVAEMLREIADLIESNPT